MTSFYPQFQKHHFNRSPSWRFDRACRLIGTGSRLDPRKDDDLTLRAAAYVRLLCSSDRPEELSASHRRDYLELHVAHRLHDQGGELRWELEARLLARQTSEEIAASLPMDVPTVDAYEAYFCNVRDRLDASDWIAGKVIGPGPRRGFGNDLPGLWKAVAYAGGPLPLEAVMACTSAVPREARFSDDLLRRARRLVDVLMLPGDASLTQFMALREELASPSANAGRATTARKSLLDDIGTVVGGSVGRSRAAEPASSDARDSRSRPELGKTTKRGATRGAA